MTFSFLHPFASNGVDGCISTDDAEQKISSSARFLAFFLSSGAMLRSGKMPSRLSEGEKVFLTTSVESKRRQNSHCPSPRLQDKFSAEASFALSLSHSVTHCTGAAFTAALAACVSSISSKVAFDGRKQKGKLFAKNLLLLLLCSAAFAGMPWHVGACCPQDKQQQQQKDHRKTHHNVRTSIVFAPKKYTRTFS